MNLQSAITYWKLRLLVDALEKITLSDHPTPGISIATKKVLKQLLAEATLKPITVKENSCAEEFKQQLGRDREPLQTWVKAELKNVAKEVVHGFKRRLDGTASLQEKELLKQLTLHSNPLDLIADKIARELEQERMLDREIEKWTGIRDGEFESCSADIRDMNHILKIYNSELNSVRYSDVMKRYSDFIQLQYEFVNSKHTLTTMHQKVAENPPEVMNELEAAYKRLLDKEDEISGVIQELSNKKSQYVALGPEFGSLLAEWNEYGTLIQQKEFVLNGIREEGTDNSFNVSLNSSLVFESP